MNTCNDHVTTIDEIEMDALFLEHSQLAIYFDCWICFLKKKKGGIFRDFLKIKIYFT